jgi:hypothetical protein
MFLPKSAICRPSSRAGADTLDDQVEFEPFYYAKLPDRFIAVSQMSFLEPKLIPSFDRARLIADRLQDRLCQETTFWYDGRIKLFRRFQRKSTSVPHLRMD